MTQTQLRNLYQIINHAYNLMAEVREESVDGMKEAKQATLNALVEITNQLKGDYE
jgi:hypothetical protein